MVSAASRTITTVSTAPGTYNGFDSVGNYNGLDSVRGYGNGLDSVGNYFNGLDSVEQSSGLDSVGDHQSPFKQIWLTGIETILTTVVEAEKATASSLSGTGPRRAGEGTATTWRSGPSEPTLR